MTEESRIHPTAIVEDGTVLGVGVEIGPYTVVRTGAHVGDHTRVGPHVVIEGAARIGARNRIFQFATVGSEPQDLKYGGEPTLLEIGDDNTIREFCSLNRGTEGGGGVTRLGSSNLMMAYAHLAHDCQVGDSVVLANCATLAGHVTVEDFAIVGGLVAIHQHVRIGTSAMLGGASAIAQDVPPYCLAQGNHASLRGLNVVGLRRRGLSAQALADLRAAYRILFQSQLRLADALARLREELAHSAEVGRMIDFIEGSQRGICR